MLGDIIIVAVTIIVVAVTVGADGEERPNEFVLVVGSVGGVGVGVVGSGSGRHGRPLFFVIAHCPSFVAWRESLPAIFIAFAVMTS